ncbi:MAG: DNA mismatch repair endonuclease MutL [Candidatus Omnitrophota bacterium]|nr:DNA mismatch repair endonuclease MutL [Candidatus Omnitrophota bacterium]
MGRIRVLPEQLANKIAAGEVIERPASIVKELVENSLDAGARSIEIEIDHGGKAFIRVSDDGAGMDASDAKLAFQRHATSKITAAEDLEGIGSYGFRGEALPSIAAVSRARLITRREKDPAGTEVVVEGGSLKGVQEHACRPGTIVEVRDLFFNTPARRKFLKADSTEFGAIQDVVCRMALCAPQTRFVLKSSDKTLLDLPAGVPLSRRAQAVFGPESSGQLLDLDWQGDGIGFRGLLGKPSLTRGNRSQIHLFVNRRWVKSLPLSYALQAGYQGMLMEGRCPVAVLFLEVDLKRVDVNVHPTKQEVRISNEPEITSALQRAVRERLSQEPDLAPSLKTGIHQPAVKTYAIHSDSSVAQPWGAVLEGARSAGLLASAPPSAALQQPIALKGKLKITRLLGQIHRTYLVAETEEGFAIIDQHAAHERVVFEALLASLRSGQAEKQMLFLEELLEVHPRQRELFKQSLPLLTKVGFDIEGFGEGTSVVRAYPAVFGEVDPLQVLRTFLEQLEEGKVRTVLEESQEALAALCACKKQSVKANDAMEPAAARKLLERLAHCENPFNCPHGRPVLFTQTLSQLEKQFKRT